MQGCTIINDHHGWICWGMNVRRQRGRKKCKRSLPYISFQDLLPKDFETMTLNALFDTLIVLIFDIDFDIDFRLSIFDNPWFCRFTLPRPWFLDSWVSATFHYILHVHTWDFTCCWLALHPSKQPAWHQLHRNGGAVHRRACFEDMIWECLKQDWLVLIFMLCWKFNLSGF